MNEPRPRLRNTPPAEPDPVAAFLDDVQRRYEVFGESDAMPRLLAAVEKVLELTDPAEASTGTYSDPGGPVTPVVRCDMIREAIRSALLGEGETGG